MAGNRKSKPGEECRRARPRGITADLIEAVMEVGERFAGELRVDGGGSLCHLQCAFDGAELAIAVQHEFERRCSDIRRLLRDVGDRPRRREFDVAGIRMQLAQKEREQARLAAAVRADQSDLVPGMNGEVRAVEQAFHPARERQICNSYQSALPAVIGGRQGRYGFNS